MSSRTDNIPFVTGSDHTFLLIARKWQQEKCDDSTSFVNRQFAIQLQEAGYKVLSTVLEASDCEQMDAWEKSVTLILPKPKRKSYKVERKDWLMHPDRYYREFKNYNNVSFIVGHVNEQGYDTVEEACAIRDMYFAEAKIVMFVHFIPSLKGYGNPNMIGECDIQQFRHESDLVVVIGENLNGYYLNLFRADNVLCYLPAPDDKYLNIQVETPPDGANIEVLTVGNFSDKSQWNCCDHIALAMGKVTLDHSSMMEKPPVWKLYDIDESHISTFRQHLHEKCRSADLTISPLPPVNYPDYLSDVFRQSVLLVDTSTDLFSRAGLNAIAAGLPVIFHKNSSIAQFLKNEHAMQVHCNDILVEVGMHESIETAVDKWADNIAKCVVNKQVAFDRAAVLREGLKKSIESGMIKKSHETVISWFSKP